MQKLLFSIFDENNDLSVYEINGGEFYKVVLMANCEVAASRFDSRIHAMNWVADYVEERIQLFK